MVKNEVHTLFFSYIKPKEWEMLTNLTDKFNEDTGLELSRQKFVMKLLRDEAKRSNNK